MAALPYMPLYVADYLADAAHLTAAEHGAYLLLIMTYWQRGKALPSDDVKLSRIARMTPDEWEASRDTIAEFFHDNGETWTHKRIEAELLAVKDKSDKARVAGKASAERRFNGRSTDVQRSVNHTDTDTDIDTVRANALTPSPASPDEAPIRLSKKSKSDVMRHFPAFYLAYPRHTAKAAAEKAWFKVVSGGADPARILEAVNRFAARCRGKEPEFIPHPATWLNQGRWDDADLWPVEPIMAADAPVFVLRTDPRWRTLAARYREAKGKDPPLANGGWHFPQDWFDHEASAA